MEEAKEGSLNLSQYNVHILASQMVAKREKIAICCISNLRINRHQVSLMGEDEDRPIKILAKLVLMGLEGSQAEATAVEETTNQNLTMIHRKLNHKNHANGD